MFTPPELARRLVEGLVLELEASTPILDPACGDGALLLAALEALGGAPAAPRLWGIEISAELAARTRQRLADATGLEPEHFSHRITSADALAKDTAWPPGAAVIANPPWLSFSGRHAAPERSGKRPPQAGWPSLQGAFLERIAAHCAEARQPAHLILPASLLDLPRYEPSRAAAFQHAHLARAPIELGESAFPGVIEPSVIAELAPGSSAGTAPTFNEPSDTTLSEFKLERFPKLPLGTFTDAGVHTGNSGAELVAKGAHEGWAALRRGADLSAYHMGGPSLSLRLDLARDEQRRFRIAALAHYTSFPILLRQTAARPVAALHDAPTYFRNSLLAVRPVPGLAPEFLVALLNSSLSAAWLRANYRDARQRTFPQMKIGALQTLPTPWLSRSEQPELHDAIVEAVTALQPMSASFAQATAHIDLLISKALGVDQAQHHTLIASL